MIFYLMQQMLQIIKYFIKVLKFLFIITWINHFKILNHFRYDQNLYYCYPIYLIKLIMLEIVV
jgi:hypothetical protein